jgi:carboxyl-terminal processing protease
MKEITNRVLVSIAAGLLLQFSGGFAPAQSMRRSVIAFALASLLGGIWTPTSHVANALEPDSLSSKDRIDIFDTVWKTINDEYYDATFNGVNWSAARERYRPRVEAVQGDEEFYAVISEMLLDLRDLHTSFVAPDTQPSSSGISVYEIEDKIVVANVDPDSDAARAGVKAGMIVRTLDGKPIDEHVSQLRMKLGHWSNQQAYRVVIRGRILRGPANTTFKLGLERADGTRFEVALTRRAITNPQAKLISYRLPSGFSYMKISAALRSPVEDQFESEFRTLKDSGGLIIDLRGLNGGDIKGVGLKIANHFFPSKVSFGKFINRSGEVPLRRSLSAEGDSQSYKGPVVILIDGMTASAAEVFASGFQENLRAKVIGEQSCGCVLDRDSKKVKGGGVLYYSRLVYISSKGRKLEGAGVVPDKTVKPTIAGLQQGRDLILEKAESILRAQQSISR